MKPPVITTIVVSSLTASIVLMATKHHMVSLIPSVFAAILVILTLVPTEKEGSGGDPTYVYSAGGGVRVGNPAKPKPRSKLKPRPRARPRARAQVQVRPPVQPLPSSIPQCNDPVQPPSNREMKDYIRNHGLYGIRGNLSCKRLERGTVADKGLLQPLNARNQMIKYLSVDQLRAKDPYLIPRKNVTQ